MKHFYEDIQGWFSFAELYSERVRLANNGDIFVEVGAWKGRSTSYMAVEIANSNKLIPFYVVDTWAGSEEYAHKTDGELDSLYEVFQQNMLPVKDYYQPMQTTSVEASKLFPDNSLSFVFIDASHDYKNVYDDLTHWFPKVKPGGTIAGHDYMSYWPEVIKAVDNFFDNKAVALPEQRSWKFLKTLS